MALELPMEIKKTYLFLIVFFCFNQIAFSNIKKNKVYKTKKQLKHLEGELIVNKSTLSKTKKSIFKIEKTLDRRNNSYLQNINILSVLERKISEINKVKDEQKVNFTNYFKELKRSYAYLLMNNLEQESNLENILTRKLFIKSLLNNLEEVNDILEQNKYLENRLSEITNRIEDYKKIGKELSTVMQELEGKKKNLITNYVTITNKVDNLEVQIYKKSNILKSSKTKKNKSLSNNKKVFSKYSIYNQLIFPLGKFRNIEHAKKGVTFKYKGTHKVLSPGDGKVSYTGKLSSYGQVILIDHGNNFKSLVLGSLNFKVKKDMVVKKGDLIAFTKEKLIDKGSLYFEIRLKNKAQNTIKFFEKDYLKSVI
jgi:septal ring factor EnvC (AmiA/AmiB activator)